jgi:transglutaminase-like putative cysteine protease
VRNPPLYATSLSPYTACEAILKAKRFFSSAIISAALLCFLSVSAARPRSTQAGSQKPLEKSPEKSQQKSVEKPAAKPAPEIPAQIELLETGVRFESDGSSRKEVHTRVKINDELGVSQFGRLTFNFDRAFQQVELPLLRITHAGGGTVDVLPSAIHDDPNPAVLNAPAYQDVRVKSVRILGLEPGDTLEYRVVTTTTHSPLAPDFWLDHTFDRTGLVSRELFDLDLPSSRNPEIRINPGTPAASIERSGAADSARAVYHWQFSAASKPGSAIAGNGKGSADASDTEPDVAVTTTSWEALSIRLDESLTPGAKRLDTIGANEKRKSELAPSYDAIDPEISAKAAELTKSARTSREKLEAFYDFVSQKIATVDLPLGATGFAAKPAKAILAAGYASPEDKFVLFAALAASLKLGAQAALTGYCNPSGVPRPGVFQHMLIRSGAEPGRQFWLDPSIEVAPFGEIPANSGKCAFVLSREFYAMNSAGHEWQELQADPPFPSSQHVTIAAVLGKDGTLKSSVRYLMRGQNELLLRVAFHKTPKENWKNVAQLLALSDGFRGQVTSVSASDPYATHEPFRVEYEIAEPKFVNWSKTPVRIPALLPLFGLPDPPAGSADTAHAAPIDLGTPLDVEVSATLRLPPGIVASVPVGTSVDRDFATYSSQYSAKDETLSASRHLNFILRKLAADRAEDYNAFFRAVQNDESQFFALERTVPNAAKEQKH